MCASVTTWDDTLAVAGAPVDRDVVSRFATCCRALGLSVHDRQRPADLAARPVRVRRADAHRPRPVRRVDGSGRRGRRLARGHRIGLADVGAPRVCCSARSTSRRARWASPTTPACTSSSAPPTPDDFQLAYAATPVRDRCLRRGRPAGGRTHRAATRLAAGPVGARRDLLPHRTLVRRGAAADARGQRRARWTRRTRTPPAIALGIALARLGMFAPALSYLEEPAGPVAVAAVDGALAKALALRAQGEDEDAADAAAGAVRGQPRERAGRRGAVGYVLRDRPPPPPPGSRRAPTRGIPTPSPARPTSSTRAPRTARRTC